MNLHEEQERVQKAVSNSLSHVQEDPWLTQRVLANAKGEEPMTKKISASAILIISLIAISMTAALAAALNSWGIINFAGDHANAYVPPKYEESITKENEIIETESVRCTLQESYYDGKILRLTAQIVPKVNALLIGPGSSVENPISDLFWRTLDPEDEETEWESIGAYTLRVHDGHLARIGLDAEMEWIDYSSDFIRSEDGSYTWYLECQAQDETQETNVPLVLSYYPMTITEEQLAAKQETIDFDHKETAVITKTFHSVETKTYVCDSPMDFPSVGVRVQNVILTVTPLEIRVTLDYAITDLDVYQAQNDGLWFEFIDPKSTATEPHAQCVSNGLTSGGSIERKDGLHDLPDEVGTVYRQTGAIGLDALSDQYTIRAYNVWDNTRYETATFRVTEAN